MNEAIRDFASQFSYQPEIQYGALKRKFTKVIVAGMGGSHLAADLLKSYNPELPLTVHRDYGLPFIAPSEKKTTLFIASSYSGNTEETIDALQAAHAQGIACAALSVGGKLEELAKQFKIPFVKLPDAGIQPRSALGLSLKGLLKLMWLDDILADMSELSRTLYPQKLEQEGGEITKKLKGCIPVVYVSTRNEAIAYNWKIKLNETGKIPAFYNVIPELNHNEMTGFDVIPKTKKLSQQFCFVFLQDAKDHPRNQKRMKVLEKLYRERGLQTLTIPLKGKDRWSLMFSSLLLADWIAYYTAIGYGAEPEQVPMVESFKKLMAR